MKSIAITLIGCLLTGCASIINGTRQNIGISSTPTGATVKADNGSTCTTPCMLELSRKISHTLTMEKEGFETASATVENSISGWIWGNLLFGGLIGLVVDVTSGGAWKLEPKNVNQTLAKLNDVPDQKQNLSREQTQDEMKNLLKNLKPNPSIEIILRNGEIIDGMMTSYMKEKNAVYVKTDDGKRGFILTDVKNINLK